MLEYMYISCTIYWCWCRFRGRIRYGEKDWKSNRYHHYRGSLSLHNLPPIFQTVYKFALLKHQLYGPAPPPQTYLKNILPVIWRETSLCLNSIYGKSQEDQI